MMKGESKSEKLPIPDTGVELSRSVWWCLRSACSLPPSPNFFYRLALRRHSGGPGSASLDIAAFKVPIFAAILTAGFLGWGLSAPSIFGFDSLPPPTSPKFDRLWSGCRWVKNSRFSAEITELGIDVFNSGFSMVLIFFPLTGILREYWIRRDYLSPNRETCSQIRTRSIGGSSAARVDETACGPPPPLQPPSPALLDVSLSSPLRQLQLSSSSQQAQLYRTFLTNSSFSRLNLRFLKISTSASSRPPTLNHRSGVPLDNTPLALTRSPAPPQDVNARVNARRASCLVNPQPPANEMSHRVHWSSHRAAAVCFDYLHQRLVKKKNVCFFNLNLAAGRQATPSRTQNQRRITSLRYYRLLPSSSAAQRRVVLRVRINVRQAGHGPGAKPPAGSLHVLRFKSPALASIVPPSHDSTPRSGGSFDTISRRPTSGTHAWARAAGRLTPPSTIQASSSGVTGVSFVRCRCRRRRREAAQRLEYIDRGPASGTYSWLTPPPSSNRGTFAFTHLDAHAVHKRRAWSSNIHAALPPTVLTLYNDVPRAGRKLGDFFSTGSGRRQANPALDASSIVFTTRLRSALSSSSSPRRVAALTLDYMFRHPPSDISALTIQKDDRPPMITVWIVARRASYVPNVDYTTNRRPPTNHYYMNRLPARGQTLITRRIVVRRATLATGILGDTNIEYTTYRRPASDLWSGIFRATRTSMTRRINVRRATSWYQEEIDVLSTWWNSGLKNLNILTRTPNSRELTRQGASPTPTSPNPQVPLFTSPKRAWSKLPRPKVPGKRLHASPKIDFSPTLDNQTPNNLFLNMARARAERYK
ncbi:hypothetical protein R3P38DRAFT_3349002 [Favolaschia claudopus]|uniref:Uncharacterized protein n=1 Tax=Favolaschia claudopus TaxID=2862362 RepID=A0AAW0CPW9_9AGAR